MNALAPIHAATSTPAILERPNVQRVRYAARELYEAAISLDCDWDSGRAPYRRERYEDAIAALKAEMERADA